MTMKSLDLVTEELQQLSAANELNLTPEELQQLETQPEDNGERRFTQEEVNQIVRERLARERAKNTPSQEEQKQAELDAKELLLNQRQFLEEHDLPVEEIMGFVDLFNIGSMSKFEEFIDRLIALMPVIALYAEKKRENAGIKSAVRSVKMDDLIHDIFKLGGRF